MKAKSVILVDDHPILASGIKNLIESQDDLLVGAIAVSAEEALKIMQKERFDILLIDYELPGMNGLEMIREVKKKLADIKIIMLSMYDDPSVVRGVIKEGVDGYVLKKDTHHSLIKAIEKVTQGKKYLSEEVSEILLDNPDESDQNPLTARETEILQLIADGYSNKEMANKLFISERTVETHRKNLMRKTGSSSAVKLLNWARSKGIIE